MFAIDCNSRNNRNNRNNRCQRPTSPGNRVMRIASAYVVAAALYGFASIANAAAEPVGAAPLRAKYSELASQLANNPFKRPLAMTSIEAGNVLKGDIYAVVEHPLSQVSAALSGPEHWCDVLMLHLNTKYCHASNGSDGATLDMRIGKKFDQPVEDAHRVDFGFHPGAASADYFNARLDAAHGPMGTSDYRILLEAVALPGKKTFLHLTYSYAYGFASKIAMKGYLATVGSDKVGFSRKGDAQSDYIGGMRGVVERNTMRYYLAIDAYLDALAAPPGEQIEKRLSEWFNATEQYARQLHEMNRSEYLDMKRVEIARLKTAQ